MTDAILITGGLGYVGGRVAQALAQAGATLRLSSRRATVPAWARAHEIFAVHDVATHASGACAGMDTVVHMAAMNEIDAAIDPVAAMRVNAEESLIWLRAAQAAGARRFVYFSTAHVYGAPLAGRLDENTLPRPRHPYAISHRVMEDFVLAAQAEKKIEGLVFRLSNAIGQPADPEVNRWTLVANALCRQAVREGKVELKSSGLQQRDFIAMQDVGAAVAHMLAMPSGSWDDGLFNLGSGKAISVHALAERIAARATILLGRPTALIRVPPGPGETAPALDFRVDKLAETGFKWRGDFAREIDATLRLCRDAFEKAA